MGRMEEPERPAAIAGEGTPEGELLREALHAFDVGDYVRVRRATARLAGAEDAEVRAAAADLAARVAVDPIQVVVLAACAALLVAILYVWVL